MRNWLLCLTFGFVEAFSSFIAQQHFGAGNVGQVFLPVSYFQFQPVTICHRFTVFLAKPFLQLIPVLTRCLKIRLLQ